MTFVDTSPSHSLRAGMWWPFALVAIVYLIVATHRIELPGVYMDAVNPDAGVVTLLNPKFEDVPTWALRGNTLFGRRAPILIAVYHGSQQFWLGLPFFLLFGTTVTGLRLTHAMFALGVLAAVYFVLLRGRLRPWQAACACIALAVDPTFSYAFRTQSYITVAPMAWLLWSIALLLRQGNGNSREPPWFWCGTLYGVAITGYFIYSFYFPVVIVLVAWRLHDGRDASERRGSLYRWIRGFALGVSPYIIGYLLAARASGGIREFLAFMNEQRAILNPMESTLSLPDRVVYAWTMIDYVVKNIWHNALIFNDSIPVPGAIAKTLIVAGGPYLLWAYAEYRRRATPLQRVLVALPVSFVAGSLIFGSRLSGHHFVPLTPVFYAALAVGLANAFKSERHPRAAIAGFAVPAVLLAGINVAGQAMESRLLAETRGIGLFSDAINRFADDVNAMRDKPLIVFPDWGLMLPVQFLTRGTVPLTQFDDLDKARLALCSGRDVGVALINGDRAARTGEWQRNLAWTPPTVVSYRQADGKVVFDYLTFRGDRNASVCGARPKLN